METTQQKAAGEADDDDECAATLEAAAQRFWRLWLQNWTPPLEERTSSAPGGAGPATDQETPSP